MTKGITLTRNGYGNWYIKDTDFNDTPDNSATFVKGMLNAIDNINEFYKETFTVSWYA